MSLAYSRSTTSSKDRVRGTGLFEAVDEMCGADEELGEQDDYLVYVPPNRFQLTADLLSQLHHTVNPLAPSRNYGIGLYLQALSFIQETSHGHSS